nr:4-coumarate--CoA ligase 1-like [Nomia melanderi]XP_031826358.1 4-coumarate--CoA ligase 1-like [Nomia melanderi]XP_031826359.1 4-coumarate--CoA ligase 1-like [Nomia melanderi]
MKQDGGKMKIVNNILHGPPYQPSPDISIQEHLHNVVRKNLDATALVDIETGLSYTYRYIFEASVKLTYALKSYGIDPDDRISIASENHPNYPIVMWAVFNTKAVFAPLNPAYTEVEYKHMLGIYEPRLIFVSRKCEPLMTKIASTVLWKMSLIQLDDEAINKDIPTLKQLLEKYDGLIDPYSFVPTPNTDNSKKMAVIICSSGTTGFPKGVTLSHRNLIIFMNKFIQPELFDYRKGDRMLNFLPLFHGYSLSLVFMTMTTSATIYIMRRFNIDIVLQSIEKYRLTHLPLVPPVLVLFGKHPGLSKYDFSSVREILCGAAPLPKDIADEVTRRLGCRGIRNGYGMTELTIVTNLSRKDCDKYDGNVGPVIPGMLCKTVDPDTGETLPPGQVGEICMKSDQVMLGYFRNPKATAETIDKDQWLHTGDLGYFNTDGILYISGRLKEVIKYKGFQVSPSEIETLIQSHPDVKDAAIIGKPDEECGEVPMAFVVRKSDSKVSSEDISNFIKKNLSPQKWLRGGVHFIEAIPKTPSGKIVRRELHSMISKL